MNYWKGYKRVTGELSWRLATPDDLPAIRRLRNVAERFLNKPQRNPGLFERPVLLALVAENSRGKIVDLVYVEAQVEIVKMALTAVGFQESIALEEDLAPWLRGLGFKTAIVTTNQTLKGKMEQRLKSAGFMCMDALLSCWKRRI